MSEVEKEVVSRILELTKGFVRPEDQEKFESSARATAAEMRASGVILMIDRRGPKPIISYIP